MGSYHSRQIADLVLLLREFKFFLTIITTLIAFLFFAVTLMTVLCSLTKLTLTI